MKLQRLRRRANLNRDHSLKNPQTFHLSYLRVDECSWKKIDQVSSAATDHCTSTAVSSARKARTSTRSFRFALFKYKYNIHLAFVNIGWYLARDMALGAHGWPRRYLPRLRLGKYCKVTNFRPVPIFVLLTWNWFVRTNFRTFEGLKRKLHWNSMVSRQK